MKNISNNYPEWLDTGNKPKQDKIERGWEAGERPPADWFDWLFNRAYQSFQDIDQGIADRLADMLTEGVLTESAVTENSTPDYNVIVESLIAYNTDGARIKLENDETVDLEDYLPTDTDTDTEKYVSIYIDVVDTETNTEINIVEGTSADIDEAEKPDINNSEGILLADVLLNDSMSEITDNDIEVNRKKQAYIDGGVID